MEKFEIVECCGLTPLKQKFFLGEKSQWKYWFSMFAFLMSFELHLLA